jgi:hypothetical protein
LDGQEVKSDRQEIDKISQLLVDFNERCLRLKKSANIEFNLTFSPPTRISSVNLIYFYSNQTQQSATHLPLIKPFISSHRDCVENKFLEIDLDIDRRKKRIDFVCDVIEQEKDLEEKINTVSFKIKSYDDTPIKLSICGVGLFQIPDNCGLPDVPLHASTQNAKSGRQVSFFSEDPKRYQLLGEDTIRCKSDGMWFPSSPPIFKPLRIGENEPTEKAQIIPIVLLTSILIALCILGAYFIWKNKKQNQVETNIIMNETTSLNSSANKMYNENGESGVKRNDENMHETKRMENMH